MDRRKRDFTREELSELHTREEDELARLKRQYRIMTNDKNAVVGAHGIKSLMDRKQLNSLRKQECNLRKDVEVAKNNLRSEDKDLSKIKLLIEESEKLEEDMESKKKRCKELDYQFRDVQKNMRDLTRKNLQNKILEEKRDNDDELKKIENRLETVSKSFCLTLADNKKLREEVESLLKSRKIFNEMWEKEMNRLNTGKRIIMDLIEQSSNAYDQREEWVEKHKLLKYKEHNMQASHNSDMRELKRKLDMQTDLGHFLETKCQKRILVHVEKREKMKKEEAKAKMESKLKDYTEMLQQIKDFSGEDNVNRIASQYLKKEEENFALFTYANELGSELEVLTATTLELKKKIDEQREVNFERASKQKRNVDTLQKELEIATIEADKADLDLKKSSIQLDQMINGVADLFNLLKCDNAPIVQLLGEQTSINQHNVLLHMTILETNLMLVLRTCFLSDKDRVRFLEEI